MSQQSLRLDQFREPGVDGLVLLLDLQQPSQHRDGARRHRRKRCHQRQRILPEDCDQGDGDRTGHGHHGHAHDYRGAPGGDSDVVHWSHPSTAGIHRHSECSHGHERSRALPPRKASPSANRATMATMATRSRMVYTVWRCAMSESQTGEYPGPVASPSAESHRSNTAAPTRSATTA